MESWRQKIKEPQDSIHRQKKLRQGKIFRAIACRYEIMKRGNEIFHQSIDLEGDRNQGEWNEVDLPPKSMSAQSSDEIILKLLGNRYMIMDNITLHRFNYDFSL